MGKHDSPDLPPTHDFSPSEWIPPAADVPGYHYTLTPVNNIFGYDRLGAGGMGSVWSVNRSDLTGSQPFDHLVIKFLSPEALDVFLEEAQAGISFRSKYLAQTIDVLDLRNNEDWPRAALIMRRYQLSLAELLEKTKGKPFGQEVTFAIARQIVHGLSQLHNEHECVHCDLKPPNILIGLPAGITVESPEHMLLPGVQVVISDFGVIRRVGQPALPLGQDGWKAPELFVGCDDKCRTCVKCKEPRRDVEANPSQDIWAFGKILGELTDRTESKPEYLKQLANECMGEHRPVANEELVRRLSRHWDIQPHRAASGWELIEHRAFVGRDRVKEQFDKFRQTRRKQQRGGVFGIVWPMGCGKTALALKQAKAEVL